MNSCLILKIMSVLLAKIKNKNQWCYINIFMYINHVSNSNSCKILHLTLDMLCQFCRMKNDTVQNALMWVPMSVHDISIYAYFFGNILETIKIKDMQVKVISYGYKY